MRVAMPRVASTERWHYCATNTCERSVASFVSVMNRILRLNKAGGRGSFGRTGHLLDLFERASAIDVDRRRTKARADPNYMNELWCGNDNNTNNRAARCSKKVAKVRAPLCAILFSDQQPRSSLRRERELYACLPMSSSAGLKQLIQPSRAPRRRKRCFPVRNAWPSAEVA
jgi:hypothetical protein